MLIAAQMNAVKTHMVRTITKHD